MRILVVMGTRPEAIKLAPVVAALRRRKGLKTFVCATAQHRKLLDQVLTLFALKPDFDVGYLAGAAFQVLNVLSGASSANGPLRYQEDVVFLLDR